jgi:dipeptidase E
MKQIIAMGGGGFLIDDNPLLDDFILSRAKGKDSRVCFVATASGDSDRMLVNFYTALGRRCQATHLPLFRRTHDDVTAYLLEHDVIYVGGGNTANMLGVWRIHGVDKALAHAYDKGIVLCGVSAGALCWFETGVTDSFGSSLTYIDNLLGLVPGSFCPHYNGDSLRRPTYQRLVHDGMKPGFAADVGAALHFIDGTLSEVVSSRPDAGAYRLECRGSEVYEEAMPVRYLGEKDESTGCPTSGCN